MVLENAIAVFAKVGGFDKPIFGFVFEGGLFDVGGKSAGERGFVEAMIANELNNMPK